MPSLNSTLLPSAVPSSIDLITAQNPTQKGCVTRGDTGLERRKHLTALAQQRTFPRIVTPGPAHSETGHQHQQLRVGV